MTTTKRTPHPLYRLFSCIYFIPFSVLIAILLLYSTLYSVHYKLGIVFDLQERQRTNPLLLLVSAFVVFSVFLFLRRKTGLFSSRFVPLLLLFAFGLLCGLFLIFGVRGLAVNDARTLDVDVVNAFMGGDFSQLTDKGSYLYIYPFQIGYVAYGQLVYLLFGKSNYTAYQFLNLICILGTLFLLYQITMELFEDREIASMAALLTPFLLFFHVSVTLIYGDIPSLLPLSAAFYLHIRFLKYSRARDEIFCALLLFPAVLLKTNSYIAVIAILLSLWIRENPFLRPKEWQKKFLLSLLLLFFGFASPKIFGEAYAQIAAHTSLPQGVPSSTYFAMAIQEESDGTGQNGWYNGYNVGTYRNNQFDHEKTDLEAKKRFCSDFKALLRSPSHAAYFYFKKDMTQWADPSFVSMRNLELASRQVEGHGRIVNSLIYGRGMRLCYFIMRISMFLIYLGTLLYCISVFRAKKLSSLQGFLILYIFGGMLFHEIWEGSSRYTMRYYIYLLPYASFGLMLLLREAERLLPAAPLPESKTASIHFTRSDQNTTQPEGKTND